MSVAAVTKWNRSDTKTRVAACLCFVSLVLCFVQGWVRADAGIDLTQYVLPVKLWMEGINPYDLAHYSENYHRLQPAANYWYYAYPNLPHSLFVMLPIALLSFETGYKVWWVVSFCCLLISFWCLIRLYGQRWQPASQWLFVAVMAQSRLIQSVAYRGQVSLFELALVLMALVALKHHRYTAAGVLAGIACMKYTLAFPIILYFVWFRQWKALLWMTAVVVIGSVVAAIPLGIGTTLKTMMESMAFFGKCVASEVDRNYHLTQWQTVYTSAFGRLSPIAAALNYATLALVLMGFVMLWRRRKGEDSDGTVFAAMVMFSLTVVYHRVYDGVFVFIVAAIYWNRLTSREGLRSPALLALGVTLFLFLFVFSFQNLVDKVSNKLSNFPVAMGINAWLCLFLLIEVFWLAWTRSERDRDNLPLSSKPDEATVEAVVSAKAFRQNKRTLA